MAESKRLYIMISRTGGKMGGFIRTFTGYAYNHVSLTLDPTFRSWVSFARYYHDAALYGGFIKESAERYLADGKEIAVRIFEIEITDEKYSRLETLFNKADDRSSGLIYNTFDALGTAVGLKITIPNAYTCLGFANKVLETKFRNIRELDEAMSEKLIFEGSLSELVQDSGRREGIYFSSIGFFRGNWEALRQMARLSARAVRR